jgi:hypothetical protein
VFDGSAASSLYDPMFRVVVPSENAKENSESLSTVVLPVLTPAATINNALGRNPGVSSLIFPLVGIVDVPNALALARSSPPRHIQQIFLSEAGMSLGVIVTPPASNCLNSAEYANAPPTGL